MDKTRYEYRSPFKFLEPFKKEDADYFYGRDDEIRDIINLYHKTNLVVLYGTSGSGKSSIANCGLPSKFYNWKHISIDRYDNFLDSFFKIFNTTVSNDTTHDLQEKLILLRELEKNGERKDYENVLKEVEEIIYKIQQNIRFKPFFVFDQFEKIFSLSPEDIEGLTSILWFLSEKFYSCNILICVQKEFSANLFKLEKRIPRLLDFKYEITNPGKNGVEVILSKTFEHFNINEIDINEKKKLSEDEKTERLEVLLKKLDTDGKFYLPFIQIYLDKLYKEDYDRTSEIEFDSNNPYKPIEFEIHEINSFGEIKDLLEEYITEVNETIVKEKNAINKDKRYADSILKFLKLFVDENFNTKFIKVNTSESNLHTFQDENFQTLVFRAVWHNTEITNDKLRTVSQIIDELKKSKIIKIDGDDYLQLSHNSLAQIIQDIPVEEDAVEYYRRKFNSDFAFYKGVESDKIDSEAYLDNLLLKNYEESDIITRGDSREEEKLEYWRASTKFRDREKKRKALRNILTWLSLLILVSGSLGIFIYYQNKNKKIAIEEKDKYSSLIANKIKKDNPTLSFRIKNLSDSDENELDSRYSYMIHRFKIPEEVIYTYQKTPNTVSIVSRNGIYTFTKNGLLTDKKVFVDKEIIGAFSDDEANFFFLTKNLRNIENYGNSADQRNIFKVFDSSGKPIGNEFSAPDSIIYNLSRGGKYILLNKELYGFKNQAYEKIRDYSDFDERIRVVRTTDSGEFLLASELGGFIYVYDFEKGNQIRRVYFPGNTEEVTEVRYFQNNEKIYIGATGKILSVDFDPTNDRLLEFDSKLIIGRGNVGITSFNKSSKGEFLISGWYDGTSVILKTVNTSVGDLTRIQNDTLWSSLRGLKSPITYANFINDSTTITGDKAGNVVIWTMSKSDDILNNIIDFSPFEINSEYNLNEPYDFYDFYRIDKKKVKYETKLGKIISYSVSIPHYSFTEHDSYYGAIIGSSIKELDTLFKEALADSSWNIINIYSKNQILDSYSELLDKKNSLINATGQDLGILERKYDLQIRKLLLDTVDINKANLLASNLRNDFSSKPIKNYQRVVTNLNRAIGLLLIFKKKYPEDKSITNTLGRIYGSLTWYCLFTKEYERTIETAQNAFKLDPKENDWINTNLALGLLLSGQYEQAKEVYVDFKDQKFSNGVGQPFKKAFLDDFKVLEEEGIITASDSVLFQKVTEIKNILGE